MSVTIVPITFFSSFPSSPSPTHFHKQIKTEHTKPRQKIANENKVYLTSIFPIIELLKFLVVGLPPVVFLSGILKSIFGHGWPWTDYNGDWNIGLRADSKIPPILFQFISFFQIISSSKEMEGALSRMRTLPWRGMFALFGGFLITVRFFLHFIFLYEIMMIRVVWCLIEISFFSCSSLGGVHSGPSSRMHSGLLKGGLEARIFAGEPPPPSPRFRRTLYRDIRSDCIHFFPLQVFG